MKSVNTDVAYDYIRKKILSGEYPPGHALMTEALATEIGVSRTPIRDAFRKLETDGLVTIRAHLGASVTAVVFGPGMLDERRSMPFVRQMLPCFRDSAIVLDAYAMSVVGAVPFDQPVVLTPQAGEPHEAGARKRAEAAFRRPPVPVANVGLAEALPAWPFIRVDGPG